MTKLQTQPSRLGHAASRRHSSESGRDHWKRGEPSNIPSYGRRGGGPPLVGKADGDAASAAPVAPLDRNAVNLFGEGKADDATAHSGLEHGSVTLRINAVSACVHHVRRHVCRHVWTCV